MGHRKLLSKLLSELCMESQDYLNGKFCPYTGGLFQVNGYACAKPNRTPMWESNFLSNGAGLLTTQPPDSLAVG